jgi:hypothetical protein
VVGAQAVQKVEAVVPLDNLVRLAEPICSDAVMAEVVVAALMAAVPLEVLAVQAEYRAEAVEAVAAQMVQAMGATENVAKSGFGRIR